MHTGKGHGLPALTVLVGLVAGAMPLTRLVWLLTASGEEGVAAALAALRFEPLRGDSADEPCPAPNEAARLSRAPPASGAVSGGASSEGLVSNACSPPLVRFVSSLRQRTMRLARSGDVDRREAQLAVAGLPFRSPWLAPCRYAQRSRTRHVGSRSSWHQGLQLASIQPQRSPPHASLPSGSQLLDLEPGGAQRALVGQVCYRGVCPEAR
jgi:hypothetical protein